MHQTTRHPAGCSCGSPECPQWQADQLGVAYEPSETVLVELCRSNSIGSHYYDPQVVECRQVTRQEASRLLAIAAIDGTYWRLQQDKSGAF